MREVVIVHKSPMKSDVEASFLKSVGRYLGTCSERALTIGKISPGARSVGCVEPREPASE